MASLLVLAFLLVLVAVGAWLIWRPRSRAAPLAAHDLDALASPYRERFEALRASPGAQDPEGAALLEQAYALCREGSALLARLQVSARTAELPISALEALQQQFFEMRERREALDGELAELGSRLDASRSA